MKKANVILSMLLLVIFEIALSVSSFKYNGNFVYRNTSSVNFLYKDVKQSNKKDI